MKSPKVKDKDESNSPPEATTTPSYVTVNAPSPYSQQIPSSDYIYNTYIRPSQKREMKQTKKEII